VNAARPRLVLVTGAPASGKTTLADRLGPAVGLPVLSRDRLKALLADALPGGASSDMDLLRQTHIALFFELLAYLLASGPGLVAESALDVSLAPTDLRPALALADTVMVHCDVTPEEFVRRFSARARRGERHRAHDDAAHLDLIARDGTAWDRYREPPPLGVPVLRVDTAAGYTPSFDAIVAFALGIDLPSSSQGTSARRAALPRGPFPVA
jgi:predicted kinase